MVKSERGGYVGVGSEEAARGRHVPLQRRRVQPHLVPVRIHFIIVMLRWTGLAPWEFESPFAAPCSAAACNRFVYLHVETH